MWWIVAAALAALVIAALIRSAWERQALKLKEYEIRSGKLPAAFDGKRLVFLSDLHGQRFGEGNRKLIEMIREARPDCILIGGDMMTVKPWLAPDFSALEEVLRAFSGEVPIYYADGNHEERMQERKEQYPGWDEQFRKLLSSYQLTYLKNEKIRLRKGREYISVYAYSFTGEQYRKFRLPALTGEEIRERLGEPDGFSVVLAHTPHYFSAFADWGADLVLSGHNHGGTIRLPLVGGVMTPQFFFFSRYAYGKIRDGAHQEIISAGLGTHSINIRLFNRPEVVSVLLRREDGKEHQ